MPLLEDPSAAFIVRVWCEPSGTSAASSHWRGSIEHVLSGQRAFFLDLGRIAEFIEPYLDQLHADSTSTD